jgi:hypothetical protein
MSLVRRDFLLATERTVVALVAGPWNGGSAKLAHQLQALRCQAVEKLHATCCDNEVDRVMIWVARRQ